MWERRKKRKKDQKTTSSDYVVCVRIADPLVDGYLRKKETRWHKCNAVTVGCLLYTSDAADE